MCLLKTFTMEELFKHLAVQRRHSGASERDLPGFQMQSFSSVVSPPLPEKYLFCLYGGVLCKQTWVHKILCKHIRTLRLKPALITTRAVYTIQKSRVEWVIVYIQCTVVLYFVLYSQLVTGHRYLYTC